MAVSDHARQLASAISALYGGVGGETQQQANAWLNSFSQQPQAWEACLELLDPALDAEVAFFCANMLLTKARKEWHKVARDQQLRMAAIISDKFRAFLGSTAQARLALQRLGLLLAAVASLSGPTACREFCGQCMSMVAALPGGGGGSGGEGGQLMAECGLAMLSALGEEIANMDGSRRRDLVAATEPAWGQIAAAAQQLASSAPAQGGGGYGLLLAALQCLHTWLGLSADGISPTRASPGQLAAAHPGLLPALAPLLAPGAAQMAAGADRVQLLATEVLCELLGPGTFGDDGAQERAALEAAAAALLSLRDAALAPGEAGAAAARGAAAVAGALAERDAELVCGASAAALPLAQLMLECVQRPEREVAQAAVEYFLMVNTVPLAARHPQMGAPLYSSLAPLLLAHARFPEGFESWADCVEEDEEAFTRFREQSASELLEISYNMVGPPLLSGLRDAAVAAPCWREAEAALFALRAVGGPARRAAAAGDAAAAGLLASLFAELCGPGGRAGAALAASPQAQATAAELVGAYAPWFEAAEGAPLDGALDLLLRCLSAPAARPPAAAALRALCSRCAARLGGAPAAGAALGRLLELAAPAVAPPPPEGQPAAPCAAPFEDRTAVAEALARVAAALPPPDAPAAAAFLAAPHVARARSVLQHGGDAAARGGPAAAQQLLNTLSDEIRLVAAIVRRLELPPAGFAGGPGAPPGAPQHPALAVLESCWPLLGAVAESPLCRQEAGLVDAVCEVFNRVLQGARSAAKPLLPTLLRSVLDIFAAHHHPACLHTLAAVAEAFGELRGDPAAAAAQRGALEGAVAASAAALAARAAAGQPAAASGELLRGLLAAGDAHLVFAQRLLLGGGSDADADGGDAGPPPVDPACLDALAEAAVQAAGLREKEPASAALGFLGHLLGVANKGAAPSPLAAAAAAAAAARGAANGALQGGGTQQRAAAAAAAHRALAPRGEALVRVLVLGACDTAPRQLLRPLAGVLYSLLTSPSLGEPSAGWLLAALQSPGLPGAAAGLLAEPDAAAFAKAALRRPPLPRGRFDALVADFAAIPRGEGTGDALLAYEL
ncbi:hypothetical protein Rsub_10710 [Raphidocelis subcapitata]|uniref:Importin N-terminal domain-containing protein n=1 Tax=Raphidocelis subcapitata TaxID=307507 RepID=A0A2V0PJX9_9CHLO|nr:hypothetical protein Rsub_10710 [Raphidocelis subcapitata]|eukprot:GBF98210.1 hypothetical protein Rsub_10710 [Raphidocelis subcapitata]